MIYDDTNIRPRRPCSCCTDGVFTVTVDASATNATGSSELIVLRAQPATSRIQVFAEAVRRAMALAREQNDMALCSARIALRRLRGDPGYLVPPSEQSTARRRRQFAGRVCGGSSRYRVMLA